MAAKRSRPRFDWHQLQSRPGLRRRLKTFSRVYAVYCVDEHLKELRLDKSFFDSISPETRVLEIGAGSGRLANYFLKNSRVRPENYEMLDIAYGDYPPFMKKKVFLLLKSGRIKVTKADMWMHNYPQNAFDHILVPQSLVPPSLKTIKRMKPSREEAARAIEADLKRLVRKLKTALKPNGTIRISSMIIVNLKERLLKERRPFPGFQAQFTSEGLILSRT